VTLLLKIQRVPTCTAAYVKDASLSAFHRGVLARGPLAGRAKVQFQVAGRADVSVIALDDQHRYFIYALPKTGQSRRLLLLLSHPS
jgi:hypothetical protein